MGKGKGEDPHVKFLHDQFFCQLSIMGFMGVSVTLSSLSAGMDDGGHFPYPYFFTGFILGPILLVNLISRYIVVNAIRKKGMTRNYILEVLNKTTCGNTVWPWSCWIGMTWCILGAVLTGLGGVNCGIQNNEDNTTTVRNNCYFDIEGEHGEMYKGFAIGLIIMHVFSFVFLFLSSCPVRSVLDKIKEDPKPKPKPKPKTRAAQARAANTPATATTPQATTPKATTPQATNCIVPSSAQPANGDVTNQAAARGGNHDIEMESLKKQLDERSKEIEKRERELVGRERQFFEVSKVPLPPSYNESTN